MQIIMTAFEPFGEFKNNSSYEGLNNLVSNNVTKIVLPVAYPDAYLKLKPFIKDDNFIILLGMAANRKMISIEERAKNILSFRIPDNNGNMINNQPIDINQKEYLYSKVDIDSLIKKINQSQESCYKSSDAGEYICNYLYFEVLNNHSNHCIFIHIPNYQRVDEYNYLYDFLIILINYINKNKKIA